MYDVFSLFIKWQCREKNIKYMLKLFKKLFFRICVIIDCIEFFVQRLKILICQLVIYSFYKYYNIFKCLVSIIFLGVFNYILDLWFGNVLDRYIIENSFFLDNIELFDEVMVDCGFNIGDFLILRRVILNIFFFIYKCFWGKGKCLNVSEVRKIRKIVNLRIYVERVI